MHLGTLSIDVGELHIWFSQLDECHHQELEVKYLSWLDASERRRYEGFRFSQHRYEFLVAHALMRSCLSLYSTVEPKAWQFSRTAYGRPEIAGSHNVPPLRFNLSHTAGVVACAITRVSDVGVDVEHVRRDDDWMEIAHHTLTTDELTEIMALTPEARQTRFYQIWTLKEAYVKARGLGLSLPLNQFSYRFASPGTIQFISPPGDETWQFVLLHLAPSYSLAAAVRYPKPVQVRVGRCIPHQIYEVVDLPMMTT